MSAPDASGGPPADLSIDEPLVRALLASQHPDLAALPLQAAGGGWDNAVLRLGDDAAVRLPRRALAAPLVVNEQRWLPVLAPRVPVATPRPIRTGTPAHGYPWCWSVVPWLPGRPLANVRDVERADVLARRLGRVLRALHLPAPHDAPRNPWRGIPLAARRALVVAQGASAAELAAFDALASAPAHTGPPRWFHGDLHPGNVLVDDAAALLAVVDFGDVGAGDPAVDLAIGWMCFDAATRAVFFAEARADAAAIARGRAWAIALAIAYRHGAPGDPAMQSLAADTLAAAC